MSAKTVAPAPQSLTLAVDGTQSVSALFDSPADARACFVFGHGAGAGMQHPFMIAVARELVTHGVATLRYQFPYMEKKSRRPDPPALCHATVRAAVAEATRRAGGVPLFAGGKSFGGRMTSQAQASSPLPGVVGLAFLGFPLHPPGKPSDARGEHLDDVKIPMLFLQGTRDALADSALIEAVTRRLGKLATLRTFQDADHSFRVPARTGKKDVEVLRELVAVLARWMTEVSGQRA